MSDGPSLDERTREQLSEQYARTLDRLADCRAQLRRLEDDYDASWRDRAAPPGPDDARYASSYGVLRRQYELSKEVRELTRERRQLASELALVGDVPAPATPEPELESDTLTVEPRSPQTRQRRSNSRMAALVAAVAVPLVVIGALIGLGKRDRGEERPAAPVVLIPPAEEIARPIVWRYEARAAKRGPGCRIEWRGKITLTDGKKHAEATAVVVFFGPDFPRRTTRGYTVRDNGTVPVHFATKKCGQPKQLFSLVSVDGDFNVRIRAPK